MRLLLFFLIINVNLCLAQAYKPLLDQTNQWHFTGCNFGCLTDVYYTDGDTLVDGMNYKILDGFHYISRTFLLRENLPEKKVYLKKIFPTFTREYLLYDFSLSEEDEFEMTNPLSPFPQNGGTFRLDSIRMKPLLNNIDYKHFYFSPTAANTVANYNIVWIEGIGSKSLINAPSGEVDINGVGQLSCFFKNQDLVYSQLDSISSCSYQTLKNETNSFSKTTILKTEKRKVFRLINAEKIKKIDFYSINGQKIKSLLNDNSSQFLSLEEFQSGLYFIVVFDEFYNRKSFKVSSR